MPVRLSDLSNSDFGTLDSSKSKNVIRYNGTTDKFDIIDIDTVLEKTKNLPNKFVETIQTELDVNNINFNGLDGGNF